MKRLVLVAMSANPRLPDPERLAMQFGCSTHTIDFDQGITEHDEDILDDGFDCVIIETAHTVTPNDLASIMRELRSRDDEPPVIFLGPRNGTTALLDFPFLREHTPASFYFFNPNDPSTYPDAMHRMLYKIFPKQSTAKHRAVA